MNEERKFLPQKGPLKLPAGNASPGDPRVLNWGQEELAGSRLSQASFSLLFPLQVLKRLSCCTSVDTRNKVPMPCKGVPPCDWWLSPKSHSQKHKAEVRPATAAAGLSACLPTVASCHARKHCQVVAAQRSSSSPRCPCKPHLQAPRREVCPHLPLASTSAMDYRAGPGSGSSQMWIPLECAFSLIVQPPKGLTAPPSIRPCLCCTPASACSTWRPSSFPTACAGTATARTRASPVGGRTLLQPGPWSWGAGGLSPSPFFFSGSRHWGRGQREKLWKTH